MLLINFLKRGCLPNKWFQHPWQSASSGGGIREQAVNLVDGVPGELASSTYSSSSVSDTVASNMSIVSTRLSRGLISHVHLMSMDTIWTLYEHKY